MNTLLIILLGVLSRLVPHPANVTAVGALAVFTGSRYSWIKSLAIMVAVMMISDLVLGFHLVMWATYGSLAISIYLATRLLKKPSLWPVAGVTLTSSVIFYLVTNFAVWVLPGSMYPKTAAGLLDSYVMALPFFRNSLIGDISYTTLFFGGYKLVTILKYRLRTLHT